MHGLVMVRSLLSLSVAAFAACADWTSLAQERTLDLYWVDVEGGAATLIVTPMGESILIDTGMPGERDAQRILRVARDVAGLERIDHLITTHFHIDHFGGAADLAPHLPIAAVYDNGIPPHNPDKPGDDASFERVIRPYREMKVGRRVQIKPGETIPLQQAPGTPALSMTCLAGMQNIAPGVVTPRGAAHASVDCAQKVENPKDTGDNANSLVFVLQYGAFEMFDGGDLTWNTEAELVCPKLRVSPVDIYDVNHHGLDTSNNPLLVRALQPTVAIMSNGVTKGCGAETFRTLQAAPSIKAIYQIHKNLRPDSEHNTVPERIANVERNCAARFIKVSVDRAGKSYTVSIPGGGHSQTFQTL